MSNKRTAAQFFILRGYQYIIIIDGFINIEYKL